MPVAYFFLGLLLLASVLWVSCENLPVCGTPGTPLSGRYLSKTITNEYKFNHEIRYSCPGWLIGDEIRTCSRNGLWTGSVPVCWRILQEIDLDIIVDSKNNQLKDELTKETPVWTRLAIRTKCTRAYQCQDLRIWVRFKNGIFSLAGFELIFPMTDYPKLNAYSEHSHESRTLCNIYNTSYLEFGKGYFTTVRFNCYSSQPSVGILLDFQPNKPQELLSLCHIKVIIHPNTVMDCGFPDTPGNGYIQRNPDSRKNMFDFRCKTGFELQGADSTFCKPDGTWSIPSPTCVPKTFECELPDDPVNGYVKQTPDGKNKSLDFFCETDFELHGANSTYCKPDGTWSNDSPTCVQKIKSERHVNGTEKFRRRGKIWQCIAFVYGALAGSAVIIILVAVVVIFYVCKRKSKVKSRKRLHNSSLRSNSFDISYHRNRNEGRSSNRHSTGTECHSNPDFGNQERERPRSDVPDILENRVLNKVSIQARREATVSAHIYADPVYSDMSDERIQYGGVMTDNVLYIQTE